MGLKFENRVAIVTGAAAGIGRSTALAFAQQGAAVVVADIDAEGIEAVTGEIKAAGGQAVSAKCDVTREADVQAMVAQALSEFGRLDFAFNNAGIEIEHSKLVDGDESEFDRIMEVNVKGVWRCP